MKNVIIRKARKQDLSAILSLVKELAAYQKAPKEVSINLKELAAGGFGKKKIYDCFVAEAALREKNKIVKSIIGIALYYKKFSTWKGKCIYLEDIIVTESWRGKGIGKLLFEEVLNVVKKEKVRRFDWQVLNWNKPAIQFYKRYNAVFDHGQINCKLVFE